MKTFTFFLGLFLTLMFNLNAQIPNNGFENWTNKGNYEDPDHWATMNSVCSGPSYSATKSNDHYPAGIGNYSLKLECDTSLTQTTGGWGVIATKAFDFPFKPAFAITGHPERLCGYVKYLPENGDEAFIRVVLFNNGVEVINKGTTVTGTGQTWQSFTVEFDNYTAADSGTIIIMAWKPMGPTDGPDGNSILFIDNLSFDNLITSVTDFSENKNFFSLYPNPASDNVVLNLENQNAEELIVNIYTVTGSFVKSEIVPHNNRIINLKNLSNGLYVFEIKSNKWTEIQKLIIQR